MHNLSPVTHKGTYITRVARLSMSALDCALLVGAAFASHMHVVERQSSCLMENLEPVEPLIMGWGRYFSEIELFMTGQDHRK